MAVVEIPVWREAPFIRLIVPFIAGILVEHYFPIKVIAWWMVISFSIFTLAFFLFLTSANQLRFRWIPGLFVHLLIFSSAACISFHHDIRNQPLWIGHFDKHGSWMIARID